MKELKELVKFAIDLGEAMDRSLSDNKLDMADLGNFIGAMQSAGPALSDVSGALSFFKAPTVEGLEEIKAFVASELQLSNEKVEKLVEKVVVILASVLELVLMMKELKAPVEAPVV